MDPESKFHDVSVTAAVADRSNGTVLTSLNLIAQGTGESERIGRAILIESVRWHGLLNLAPTIADPATPAALGVPQTSRLVMVLDRQANGANPTVSGANGVFDTALGGVAMLDFDNLVNQNRFDVLYDEFFTLNPQAGAGDGSAQGNAGVEQYFDTGTIALDLPFEFNAALGAITEIRSNNLVAIIQTSSVAAVTSLNSKVRVRFCD